MAWQFRYKDQLNTFFLDGKLVARITLFDSGSPGIIVNNVENIVTPFIVGGWIHSQDLPFYIKSGNFKGEIDELRISKIIRYPVMQKLAIIHQKLPKAGLKVPYSIELATDAAEGQVVWELSAGKLPVRLSLDKKHGVIHGKPSETVASRTVTIGATDAAGRTDKHTSTPSQNSSLRRLSRDFLDPGQPTPFHLSNSFDSRRAIACGLLQEIVQRSNRRPHAGGLTRCGDFLRLRFSRRTNWRQREVHVLFRLGVVTNPSGNAVQPYVIQPDRQPGRRRLQHTEREVQQWVRHRKRRSARGTHLPSENPGLQRMQVLESVCAVIYQHRIGHFPCTGTARRLGSPQQGLNMFRAVVQMPGPFVDFLPRLLAHARMIDRHMFEVKNVHICSHRHSPSVERLVVLRAGERGHDEELKNVDRKFILQNSDVAFDRFGRIGRKAEDVAGVGDHSVRPPFLKHLPVIVDVVLIFLRG